MSNPKQLIQLAQHYGAKLKRSNHDTIKVINGEHLPNDLIEQLRANKADLLEYLGETFLDTALKRALDGYDWLLERKQQQYQHNHIPISEVTISVNEWRTAIANVIGLTLCEVEIVENILIHRGDLIYCDRSRCIMPPKQFTKSNDYLPDNSTGQAFNDWLNSGRQFVYS